MVEASDYTKDIIDKALIPIHRGAQEEKERNFGDILMQNSYGDRLTIEICSVQWLPEFDYHNVETGAIP